VLESLRCRSASALCIVGWWFTVAWLKLASMWAKARQCSPTHVGRHGYSRRAAMGGREYRRCRLQLALIEVSNVLLLVSQWVRLPDRAKKKITRFDR